MRGNEDEQRTGREVSLLRPNTRLNAPYKCPTPRESDWRADPHRRSRNQVRNGLVWPWYASGDRSGFRNGGARRVIKSRAHVLFRV